jgi:tetratricopeptide (TPR) repeat protein
MKRSSGLLFAVMVWSAVLAAAPAAHAQQDDPALVAMYMGRAAYDEGRPAEAEMYFTESVRLLRARPADQHGFLVYPLSGLASVQLDAGRYSEALQTSEEALGWASDTFGARSEPALMALNAMGSAMDELADPRAVKVWEEALDIAQALPAVESPEARLTPLSNHAAALLDRGDPGQAEEINRTVLAQRRAIYGGQPEGRFYVTVSQLGLASALARQGRVEEAEQIVRAALAEVRDAEKAGEKLRSQDLVTASLISLSDLLIRLKRHDDAEALLSSVIATWGADRAPPAALNNLALLKFARGEQAEGLSLFRDVYRLRLETAWANAPDKPRIGVEAPGFASRRMANHDLLVSAGNLARALFDTGEHAEALALQRGVMAAHGVLAGEQGLAFLEARVALGEMLAARDDPQGLIMLRQGYEAFTDAPEFANAKLAAGYSYGRELTRMGRAKEAFPLVQAYADSFSDLSRSNLLTWRDARQFLNGAAWVFEDVLETSWAARG